MGKDSHIKRPAQRPTRTQLVHIQLIRIWQRWVRFSVNSNSGYQHAETSQHSMRLVFQVHILSKGKADQDETLRVSNEDSSK